MTGPQEIIEAGHAFGWHEVAYVVIAVVLSTLAEVVRRLWMNHYKSLGEQIDKLDKKLTKHHDENRRSHEGMYARLGELETEQAVQKERIDHIGGN